MNDFVAIMITPVANGWVVQLPPSHDPQQQMFAHSLAAGLQVAKQINKDPMMPDPDEDNKPEETSLRRDTRTFIFQKFDQALAFLLERITE